MPHSELDAGRSQMNKTLSLPWRKSNSLPGCSALPALWLGLLQTLIPTEKSLSYVQQELWIPCMNLAFYPPPLPPQHLFSHSCGITWILCLPTNASVEVLVLGLVYPK
jgi:hypothetical protein